MLRLMVFLIRFGCWLIVLLFGSDYLLRRVACCLCWVGCVVIGWLIRRLSFGWLGCCRH